MTISTAHDPDRPLWRTLDALSPTRRRIVVAAVVCLVTLAAMGPRPALTAATVGALWVLLFHSRPVADIAPPAEYLERRDAAREREAEEEYAASGEGARAYERLLRDLLQLAGGDVTVLVGVATGGWRPLARLTGRLHSGQNISVVDEPERIGFYIGEAGNVLFLDRERFVRGRATYELQPDGALMIEDVDGDSLRLSAVTRTRARPRRTAR